MASSSSWNPKKSYQYDVFLSFRGEDTRKTFVDHLYVALDQQGIYTFKDDVKLEKGRNISDDLLQSIEESRLYIIVFSKSYASSSWCLNELLKIMECHITNNEHIVFPVFYDVDPSEVRKQEGLVGEALATHTNRNELVVGKWKEALTKAANFSGWDVKNVDDGHEAKVIKLIVEQVTLNLRSICNMVDENLVGMEQRMRDLYSLLEIGSNDIRMIGIKGMGGAGKTTLAEAIFDEISIKFEATSFVENVREKASMYGLEKLQKQVLHDVLKDKSIPVRGVREGKNLMKIRMRDKKVLVVLDDVDHEEQLEELAGDTNWFKPGSRIIITTRDEQVLNIYTVKWIIDVNLLSYEEAMRLFSRHAFRRNIPVQEYEIQSREVVRYAAGLPLTIKVLGSFLRGKNKPEWIDALKRLKTIPLKETLKKLELSYESLEDDYKEIFLDIACFLRHQQKDDAIRVLESCGLHPKIGLKVLEQKSLIKIQGTSRGGDILMHEHIVEMGQNIVRREHPDEPNKHSRLWVQEEIEHVLANGLGTEATLCVDLKITPSIVLESLVNMKRLRCLIVNHGYDSVLEGCAMIDETRHYFPNSLRYTCWNMYPHWCLPKTFEANNLVSLDITSNEIEQLWEGGKVMKKLKFLRLDTIKLTSLNFGLTPNLEILVLENCQVLPKINMHGECLKSLVYLNLTFCSGLRSLDLVLMPNLERLKIELCHDLAKLDLHGECLKSLVYLKLINCWSLWSLDLWLMPNLERLNIDSCQGLANLELHGECLKSLVYLSLNSCWSLRSLDLGLMPDLERLNLEFCRALEKLDLHGECLKSLVCLNLDNCENLRSLDLGSMPNLERLNVEHCFNLEKIDVHGGCLKSLVYINLCYCHRLESILFIEQLESLEILHLTDLNLSKFPNDITTWQSKNSLLKLNLSNNYYLEEVPSSVGNLHKLVSLDLSCCSSLKSLPESIWSLQHLKTLILSYCRVLEKLSEDVGQLESLSLEELDLSLCDNLKDIPSSICKLKHLRKLNLRGCRSLGKLPDELHYYVSGINRDYEQHLNS